MSAPRVWPGLAALAILAGACAPARRSGGVQGASPRRWPALAVSAAERPALVAALRAVAAALPPDTAAACLAFRGPLPAYWYRPDPGLLAAVTGGARRVVALADCPRTYESMIARVDSAGRPAAPLRPPGYVDPHELDVRSHALAGPDSATMAVTAAQGTHIRYYECAARREPGGAWRARCALTGQGVSAVQGPAPEAPNAALELPGYAGSLRRAPRRRPASASPHPRNPFA